MIAKQGHLLKSAHGWLGDSNPPQHDLVAKIGLLSLSSTTGGRTDAPQACTVGGLKHQTVLCVRGSGGQRRTRMNATDKPHETLHRTYRDRARISNGLPKNER